MLSTTMASSSGAGAPCASFTTALFFCHDLGLGGGGVIENT